MNQSYGDEFKKVCEGLVLLCMEGILPFVFGLFLGFFVTSCLALHAGKEKGRHELIQEFNKTGWYYDERAKEFWRKESTCK